MLHKGKGRLHPDMMIVEICKFMGWDYITYSNQPSWFIDLVTLKMNLEGEYQNKQSKKIK